MGAKPLPGYVCTLDPFAWGGREAISVFPSAENFTERELFERLYGDVAGGFARKTYAHRHAGIELLMRFAQLPPKQLTFITAGENPASDARPTINLYHIAPYEVTALLWADKQRFGIRAIGVQKEIFRDDLKIFYDNLAPGRVLFRPQDG